MEERERLATSSELFYTVTVSGLKRLVEVIMAAWINKDPSRHFI